MSDVEVKESSNKMGSLSVGVPRLKENIVKDALDRLDWQHLKNHLDSITLDKAALESLVGYLRRCNSLVMPYPNPKREASRRAFGEALMSYTTDALGSTAATLIDQELSLLEKIEAGYRGIVGLLEKCDISRLPAEARAAAYISRAAEQFCFLQNKLDALLNSKENIVPAGSLLLSENGQQISPDAAHTAIVESLSITLLMEGYKNKWYDKEGNLVLPVLPKVSEEELYKAGSTELLAMCWRRWQRTERRRRYLGGTFTDYAAPNMPNWVPQGLQYLTTYDPPSNTFYDYAANERLNKRLGQTYLDMLLTSNVEDKATGIQEGIGLLPTNFVSSTEAHAAVSLSEILSYGIADDEERLGGLRLVEWLRGFSVLQQLTKDHGEKGGGRESLIVTIPFDELVNVLHTCGLDPDAAKRFIALATLKAGSYDLFDCPVIKVAGGSMLVFGPALIGANLARIILSSIGNLGEPLARKGKAFERDILSFLQRQNLDAKAFKVTKDGEEYEYDVVLNWGDYVFVFECKNHSLSNHNPIQAYYFNIGIKEYIKQVKRLADALRRYPDILADQFGVDVAQKTIVPCLLNALPYSLSGDTDGVYVTDSSALKRFFEQRYFNIKTSYQIHEKLKLLHRTAMYSLWSSETPSPKDLLRQLKSPFQVKLIAAHTKEGIVDFAVGESHGVVSTDHTQKEMSVESFANLAGIPYASVRKEMDSVAGEVKKLRKKVKKRKTKSGKRRK